ncbi:MAG: hypothetical protein A4E64_00478 [Syntrophorhabdus sp. PtaU1.Bin058]|nr:MAG: hypothetical protein A4E64_00478 [Syntrophorhabdus sp. PtaU1.Bin058]
MEMAAVRFPIVVLLVFSLVRCATIGSPTQNEEDSIKQGKQSIVLVRIVAEVPDRAIDYALSRPISLANIDKGEIPKIYPITHFPSPDSKKEGWIYLLLEPGTYYFSVLPTFPVDSIKERDAETAKVTEITFGKPMMFSTFWFQVPKDTPLLYIGSLKISCEGRRSWWTEDVTECSDAEVADESAAAQELAGVSLNQYGPLRTMVLSRYGKPDEKRSPSPAAGGFIVKGPQALSSPEWVGRGIDRGIGAGTIFFLGGAYGILPFIAYLPVGTAAGLIGGSHSQNKWGSCMEELTKEFKGYDVIGNMTNTIAERSPMRPADPGGSGADDPSGTARENDLENLLIVNIQEVSLRECETSWTFCLEMEIRARLWDTVTERFTYDRLLSYTFEKKSSDSRNLYVLPVSPPSPCRDIEIYCGKEGPAVFRDELSRGITSLTEKLIKDLAIEQSKE